MDEPEEPKNRLPATITSAAVIADQRAPNDISGDIVRPDRGRHEAAIVAPGAKSEQTGTGFRLKAAGDFGGKRHLISLQSGT
ncbi:MAG: hypothetical protein WB760_12825 [Xanthobacteraceae bacterium]